MKFFGWPVKRRDKDIHYDVIICIAMNFNFKPEFYVFDRKTIDKIQVTKKNRFEGVEKRIFLFDNVNDLNKIKSKYEGCVDKFNKKLQTNKSQYKNNWKEIDKYL